MTKLIKLTTFAAVLTTFTVLTQVAVAGSCYRPPCSPRRPVAHSDHHRAPGFGAPGLNVPRPGGPGVGGPGVGGSGVGGPGAGGPGVGGQQGAGQQGGGGQAQQAGRTQAVNVPAGATVTLPGNRGTQAGQVNLVLNGVRLPLNVLGWDEAGVTVTLPEMQITSPAQAQLEIVRPGSNAETLSIQLQPRPAILVVQ